MGKDEIKELMFTLVYAWDDFSPGCYVVGELVGYERNSFKVVYQIGNERKENKEEGAFYDTSSRFFNKIKPIEASMEFKYEGEKQGLEVVE